MKNKIKTVFVDDDFLALGILKGYATLIDEIEIVAQIQDPTSVLTLLQETQVDLMFLDVHMNKIKGNELLKILNPKPVTVFTTAFTDYAIEAYELDAVDYLIKPFSFERFLQAFNKASEVINNRSKKSESGSIIHTNDEIASNDKFITIKDDKKLIKIYHKEIFFLEGCKEYVKIYTENAVYITLERLKNFETILPKNEFLRVHKSFIISIKKAKQLSGNEILINDFRIPLSREMKEDVVKKIFGKTA